MKKLLALFLAALFVFSTASVLVGAVGPLQRDSKNIVMMNFLDFNPETNALWAQQNANGEWECFIESNNFEQPEDADGNIIGPYLVPRSSFNENTTWSFIENGEVLHFETTGDNVYPGLSFMLDEYYLGLLPAGKESSDPAKAEYVKIRVRNYSTAGRFTFAFTAAHTNTYRFMEKTVADLITDTNGKDYISASGEWETYIINYNTINANTNYGEFLTLDDNDVPQSCWGGNVREFLIFPFGYNVEDGTGSYPGASIDIDYIVIGSLDYVTNYKSQLEIKEEKITNLELISEPTKKDYYVGESLDLEGLQLRATYNDGTSEILTSASYSVNLETASDSAPVTLSFGPLSAQYNVKVTGVKDIEVVSEPETKVYELADIADGFVPDGFSFKVNYTDGTSSTDFPNEAFRCMASDLTSPGTKTITANFYGITTTFDIDVINVTGLEVTVPEAGFRYNDAITEDNFTINLVFNDGSKKLSGDDNTVTELEYTIDLNTKTPGDAITGTITGVDTANGINVTEEFTVKIEAPTEMVVTKQPTKTTYQPGEQFDPTGMAVSFVYADGKKIALQSGDFTARADLNAPGTARVSIRSAVEGISLNTSIEVTVEGDAIVSGSDETTTRPTSTRPAPGGDTSEGISPGIIVVIIVAVVAVAAVVVVLVVLKKKKK